MKMLENIPGAQQESTGRLHTLRECMGDETVGEAVIAQCHPLRRRESPRLESSGREA